MKFLVTFQMPHTGLDAWLQLPEEERKAEEVKMESAWNAWKDDHQGIILETAGVSKPKRISAEGITDARNDIMMYSFIEAESLEAAAELFKDHPHFGIPGGWIEVMSTNPDVS